MGDQERDDEDWEGAGPQRQPIIQHTDYITAYRFYKRFQLQVLLILCLFVFMVLSFDAVYKKDYIKDVLTFVLPLFTFVLGMGSKSRDDN